MTLATHAVVGGSMAALFPSHPLIAFVAGFCSHFIFDAIPHWDYKILSPGVNPESGVSGKLKFNRNLILDISRIGGDILLGILVTVLIWQPTGIAKLNLLMLGIIGAILPDFLQFVYKRFPHQPMTALQKFHKFIHADYRLDDQPIIGVLSQIFIMVVVVILVKFLVGF